MTFEPGARTAWHTHPLGQTLIETAGCGRAPRWGGPIEEIQPGDVVWIPPGEKHWPGAAPTTAMTHFAIEFRKTPVRGCDTQWYKNVLKNPKIRIDARGAEAEFNAAPITDAKQVASVVEKFRARYGAGEVKKYYSKFDVAVVARTH